MKITKIKVNLEYEDDDGNLMSALVLDTPVESCEYSHNYGIEAEYDSSCGPPRYVYNGENSLTLKYKIKPKI